MSEDEWVALVHAVGGNNPGALHTICSRMSSSVFTLLYRITGSLRISEELIVNVFEDLWLRSRTYRPAYGPVTRWIMNQARFRAIERMRFEHIRRRFGTEPNPSEEVLQNSPAQMLLDPPSGYWHILSERISASVGNEALNEPQQAVTWIQVAPGISVELVSIDEPTSQLSLLVRLAPGADYPPHRHAAVEELHLLHGELKVDEKNLQAGDFLRAEPGTIDHRVWSDTGCICFLMTSARDTVL